MREKFNGIPRRTTNPNPDPNPNPNPSPNPDPDPNPNPNPTQAFCGATRTTLTDG